MKTMKHSLSLIAMLAFCSTAPAQKVTQHKRTAYEWIDTCTAKYAVMHDWLGRCGVYDLESDENITELEYRNLSFVRTIEMEDDSQSVMFIADKGHRKCMVSVDQSGQVLSMTMPDGDMQYFLDSCRTVDSEIAETSARLLEMDMKAANGTYGQAFVMEAQSGNIKAWVALEDEFHSGKYSCAPLLRNQSCNDPMKPILAAIAMTDAGLSLNDSVDTHCGTDTIGDLIISDQNCETGGYGRISYLD